MGCDAVIYATSVAPISAHELLVLSRELAEAVGPNYFAFDPSDSWQEKGPPKHALSRVTDEDEVRDARRALGIPDAAAIFTVNLWQRYYGPGYERGSLPIIAAICEWLGARGFTAYYGGDSDMPDGMRRWEALRAALWAHWAKVGGRPYRQFFDDGQREPWCSYGRVCHFCDAPMTRHGWGGGFAAFSCLYCGRRDETHDSGATWTCKRGDGEKAIDPEREEIVALRRGAPDA